VGILIKHNLKCSIVNLDTEEDSCNIEKVALKVQLCNLISILVCSLYRHPEYSSFTLKKDYECLNSRMCAMKSFNLNFYLLGDFNLRDSFILPLLTSLEGMLLRQIIQEPTRKDKLLDLIIVNNFDSIISSDVYDASLGDHLLTECTINAFKTKTKEKDNILPRLQKYP
jgi:hypothetical protein